MGLSDEEIKAIFRVVSAVLLFGNLKFAQDKTSDQAYLVDDKVAQKICKLLGLPVGDFMRAFVKPKLQVFLLLPSDERFYLGWWPRIFRPLTNCRTSRIHCWSHCKSVLWASVPMVCVSVMILFYIIYRLVQRINRSLDRTRQNATSFIGILDIAG